MAASSKYIQLTSSILMEYIYSDQSAINTVGNEYRISTVNAPIWKTVNGYTNQPQILNADSAEIIQDSLPIGTGNVRNRSFAILAPFKCALLDIDKVTFYNDYDPKLTPSASLPISFASTQSPVYDTVRFHLAQGFNFEEYQGFVVSLKAKDKAEMDFVLANFAYLKGDSWETYNPSPFFFGGKIYNAYVEVRVLSLFNLINDYWFGPLNGDTVVEKITDQVGIKKDQLLQVYFSFVNNTYREDGQDYIDLIDAKSLDLPLRDQFEKVSAYIAESDGGDYIDYYATYGGEIIENYILSLNQNGGNYMLLHDLTISEYVYDPNTGLSAWVKTDDIQTLQDNEFGTPNLYRPIIKNSGAIAFKIDYTIRLFNRDDNSQVWKSASMISYSAAKYGRKLKSINLGNNPVQSKIYNKTVVKEITVNKLAEPFIANTKYITSVTSLVNVSITTETSTNAPDGTNSSGTQNLQIFGNGLARVHIPDSAVFLKFVIYQFKDGGYQNVDISGLGGESIISFVTGTNEDFDIPEFPTTYTDPTRGEILFRISQENAKKILALSNKTFSIYQKNEYGDKTFLYAGNFYNTDEFKSIAETNRIANLELTISDNLNNIQALNSQNLTQQNTINSLLEQIASLNEKVSTLQSSLAASQNTITNLNNQVTTANANAAAATAASSSANSFTLNSEEVFRWDRDWQKRVITNNSLYKVLGIPEPFDSTRSIIENQLEEINFREFRGMKNPKAVSATDLERKLSASKAQIRNTKSSQYNDPTE